MYKVGAYEAKTRLSELLARVMRGERITITKHGVPVAVLQSPEAACKEDPEKVIEELRRFRTQHTLNGLFLRDMLSEGRK
jgi:prevent-host-death family protein